jgi:hypothetical protein
MDYENYELMLRRIKKVVLSPLKILKDIFTVCV